MGQTIKYKFPYPESEDNANVPFDLKKLADAIDSILKNLDNKKADTSVTDSINISVDEIRQLASLGLKNVTYNSSNGIMTFTANNGTQIIIDLPLELIIESGTYNSGTKSIILTLANKDVIEIPIGDLLTDIYTKKEVDDKESALNKTIAANKEDAQNQIDKLGHRVDILEKTTLTVFEIERKIIDSNGGIVTTTAWTRRKDAIGKNAQATKDGSEVANDFDNAPIYRDIISAEIDSNGNIIHYIDENGYNTASGNDIFTIIPEHWQCRYQETRLDGIYEIRGVATQKADSHYYFCKEQQVARYEGTLVNNKLRSISGSIPLYNKNINQFRTYAKANGSDYGLEDVWVRSIIENLFLVEYANSHSQSVLGNGIMTFRDYTCALAETNTNRFLTSSSNTGLPVGRSVCIGATAAWQNSVVSDRIIESSEKVTINGTTYNAYTLSGAPFNTTTSCHLWGSAQKTGWCDDLGMKSGCLVNDGNHSVIYRGIENPFGDMWEFIDGINLKAGNGTYVCRDYTKYASDKYDNGYESIGYIKYAGEGWAKQMGYDENNPEIALPIVVGANDSSGYCDYYYNNNHTSNRVALLGGGFDSGTQVRFILLALLPRLWLHGLEHWLSTS